MVNFYDSYQQSKVMNYIPETAKGLLKAQKDQVDMDSKYYALVSDMSEKANAQFISTADSKEYSDLAGSYMNKAKGLMDNKSLDLDPSSKFRAIAKVQQEMIGDKRMQTLVASNKNMAKEMDKVDPSLQGYVDRSIRPSLRTPNDGTVWSQNFGYSPDSDFKAIGDEIRSVISSSIMKHPDGSAMQNPDGSVVSGITDDRIEKWISDNGDRLAGTKPGALFAVVDMEERKNASLDPNGNWKKIDVTDPIQAQSVLKKFNDVVYDMFSQYAKEANIGGKKNSFTINNNEARPTDPLAPIDILYDDLIYSGLFDHVGSKIGVMQNGKERKHYFEEFSKKVESIGASGAPVASKRIPVTDAMHSEYLWGSGARAAVVKATKSGNKQIEVQGLGKSSSITALMSNKVTIFPKIDQNTFFVANIDKSNVTGYNLRGISTRLSELADNDMVSMAGTSGQSKGDYMVLPNGQVGSIAKIKIPMFSTTGLMTPGAQSPIKDPILHLFGPSVASEIRMKAKSNGAGGEISIPGFGKILFRRVDIQPNDSPDLKGGSYMEFDIAKPIGRMTGPSLSAYGFNSKYGGAKGSQQIVGSSNTYLGN